MQNSFSSLSGLKGKIFKKDDKNNIEYCCAFAGTDTDGVYEFIIDGYNDIINFLYGIAPQYIEAAFKAVSISNSRELTFVGHSLGGGLASLSSMLTGKNAITFNSASITGGLLLISSAASLLHKGKIIQYQSCGRYTIDPVNLVQSFYCRPSQGKIVPVYVGSEFSHSLCEIINAFNPNIDLNK